MRRLDPELPKLTGVSQAFENTSTSIAAAQMRNALTGLSESCKDPKEKKVRQTGSPELAAKLTRVLSSSRRRWTTSSLSSGDT